MSFQIAAFLRAHPRWATELGRVLRFGITGVVCSGVHYGVYCLVVLVARATVAYTAGYAVGLVLNYFLTTYFTFRKQPSKRNLTGFVGSHAINYLLEIGLLNFFLWIGLTQWIAPVAVMVVAVPINFCLLQLVYTFKRTRNKASNHIP